MSDQLREFQKVCSKCGEPKLASPDRLRSQFSPAGASSRGDGYYYYCKTCNAKRSQARSAEPGVNVFRRQNQLLAPLSPEASLRMVRYEEEYWLRERWAAKGFEAMEVLDRHGRWIRGPG